MAEMRAELQGRWEGFERLEGLVEGLVGLDCEDLEDDVRRHSRVIGVQSV